MSLSRRQFLTRAVAGVAATAVGAGLQPWQRLTVAAAPEFSSAVREGPHHLAWVWQFSSDGSPAAIRRLLADHGLGLALKTHDGTTWMAEYDKSPDAVSGPEQFATIVRYFESAGVPVHAWTVLKGRDPRGEAEMAAQVMAAGARSLSVDLEPHGGFWSGSPDDARVFGAEFRNRQPNAWLSVSVDPRPWQLERVPIREFAAFSNELAPQLYWDSFNTEPNVRQFARRGMAPGDDGITAPFLVNSLYPMLASYGLPLHHIGQGNTGSPEVWDWFVEAGFAQGASSVSTWRYGVTNARVWQALKANPPRTRTYVVQPGDTLSKLSREWGVSVDAIAAANGIDDPNRIQVGQVLVIPAGARA